MNDETDFRIYMWLIVAVVLTASITAYFAPEYSRIMGIVTGVSILIILALYWLSLGDFFNKNKEKED